MVAQAGGVVFRLDGGTPRFLVITARKNPNCWIFPKGHIHDGECGEHAAIREVREEAGVEATARARLGALEFIQEGCAIRVDFYLLEYNRWVGSGEPRSVRWCTYNEAFDLLTFEKTREILRQALRFIQNQLDGRD